MRAEDGRCVADFMMLVPGLGARPIPVRERIAGLIREACAGYGGRVVFADVNYAINVVWVSVLAEPGLAGDVARSIRERVPDALLVGGQLGGASTLPVGPTTLLRIWRRLRGWSRRALPDPNR